MTGQMVQKQLGDPLRDLVGGVVADAGESGELVVGGDDRFYAASGSVPGRQNDR